MSFSLASLSLVCLVVQSTALVLLTRYSKSPEGITAAGGERYFTSTVVLNQEIVKLLMCLVMFGWQWKGLRDARSQSALSGAKDDDVIYVTSPVSSWGRKTINGIASNSLYEGCGSLSIKDNNNDGNTYFFKSHYYYNFFSGYMDELQYQVFQWSTIRLIIPALLFTLQNYLIFISLTHIDPLTFLMLSQSKLISAAVFSVLMLGKKVSKVQWFSLALLVFGVIISQKDSTAQSNKNANQKSPVVAGISHPTSTFIGVSACLISSMSSSFAGVYFEKVVKNASPTLAVGNIHLSIFALPFSFISMMVTDVIPAYYNHATPLIRDAVLNGGQRQQSIPRDASVPQDNASFSYFRGYNMVVYIIVLVNAIGGLLVALVMKYAGNIQKGFANAVSVVVSGVFMAIFWGYLPTIWFCVGSSVVFAATAMFRYDEGRK